MKNKLIIFVLLTVSFCSSIAQTVIKIPFRQQEPFVVTPLVINESIVIDEPIVLGLDVEIHGGSGQYLFSWVLDGKEIGTEPTITINKKGIYSLIVKDGKGCESEVIYRISNGTRISNAENSTIALYPNPTQDIFSVNAQENQPLDKVEIHNMEGKKVLVFKGNQSEFDVKALPNGHYLVTLHFVHKSVTKILIRK